MGRLRHENRALRQGNVASLVSLTASDDATTITSTGLLKGGLGFVQRGQSAGMVLS